MHGQLSSHSPTECTCIPFCRTLQRIVVEGRVEGLEVGWSELNHRMMDPVMAQRSVQEQQMVALQVSRWV